MSFAVRPADPTRDYPRLVELINSFERQKTTVDELHASDRREGGQRYRLVAERDQVVIGCATIARDRWEPPGYYVCWIIVDPACRSQGIGSTLFDDALAFARTQGAMRLVAEVLDNDPSSQRFAEKRGFTVFRHVFEATIDLKTFDEARFAGIVARVEASGIRLFSLAEAGDNDDNLRRLWDVNYRTALDDPASIGAFPDFDQFRQILRGGNWFRPDGQILAADGDCYVGLSAVGYFGQTNSAYNMMTGVLPAYRGRQIASALKLRSIRAAKSWGVDFIRTNNDSDNAPMLAINRKLGYQPEPGIYRLVRYMGQEPVGGTASHTEVKIDTGTGKR